MIDHDENHDEDVQDEAVEAEAQSHADEPADESTERPHPGDDALDEAHDKPHMVELDDHAHDTTPEVAIAENLRDALGTMREEADRIATLETGDEQVQAAEKFAEDAGKLDEQVGAAARATDAED